MKNGMASSISVVIGEKEEEEDESCEEWRSASTPTTTIIIVSVIASHVPPLSLKSKLRLGPAPAEDDILEASSFTWRDEPSFIHKKANLFYTKCILMKEDIKN